MVVCARRALQSDGTTPLWMACDQGHDDVVETLLTFGAAVNLAATVRGADSESRSCRGFQSRVSRVFLLCSQDGSTPLRCAIVNGHGGVVDVLLDNLAVATAADVEAAADEDYDDIADDLRVYVSDASTTSAT